VRKLTTLFFVCVLSFYNYYAPFPFHVENSGQRWMYFVPLQIEIACAAEVNSTQNQVEEMIKDSMKESFCKAHRRPAIMWHPALPVAIRTYIYDKGYEWCRDYLLKKRKNAKNDRLSRE